MEQGGLSMGTMNDRAKRELVERARAITDWLVSHYLETGKDATVAEIAAGLGWPESRVRRVLGSNEVNGIDVRLEHRESYSKDYPGFTIGAHRVWLYGPHRDELAARLRAADWALAKVAADRDDLARREG